MKKLFFFICLIQTYNKFQITNLCETEDDDDDEIVQNGTADDDSQVLI